MIHQEIYFYNTGSILRPRLRMSRTEQYYCAPISYYTGNASSKIYRVFGEVSRRLRMVQVVPAELAVIRPARACMHGINSSRVAGYCCLASPLEPFSKINRLPRPRPRILSHVEVSWLCLGLVCSAPGVAPPKGEHPRMCNRSNSPRSTFFALCQNVS